MAESLRHKTVRGVVWSGIERVSSQAVQIIVNIVLARILVPGDFGLVAEILVFIQLSQLLVDSGFTTALIQRKDRKGIDFSTIFYFNVAVALVCYAILYLCSPLIADFYDEPLLKPLARVAGLNFVLGAIMAVPRTKLTIDIRFKEQSIISFVAAFVSGSIAIWLAYSGWGVWSLVLQTLISFTLQTIMTWCYVRWIPKDGFSLSVLRSMLGYSSKCLVSSMINLLYVNLYPLLIGKFYNKSELGFYNRGDFFAMMAAQTIGNVISRVAFPIFSSIQDDDKRLRSAYSKYIRFSSVVIFPVMIGLLSIAHPLISVVLTDKWLPAVPMLQILCIAWSFDHISQINLNVLYVKGRSDLALRLEIIKKTIAFTILGATVFMGLYAICWGRVLYGLISVILNTHYTNRLIHIGRIAQLKDFMPSLLSAILMGVIVGVVTLLPVGEFVRLCLGITTGIATYILIIYISQRTLFDEFVALCRKK